jgi:hypothetical protein
MSGFKRAVRIIALVWIISLIAAIPYALFTRSFAPFNDVINK